MCYSASLSVYLPRQARHGFNIVSLLGERFGGVVTCLLVFFSGSRVMFMSRFPRWINLHALMIEVSNPDIGKLVYHGRLELRSICEAAAALGLIGS